MESLSFQGAVMKEQSVTFALVVVRPSLLNDHTEAVKLMDKVGRAAFPGLPVILVAQNERGVPTYLGRQDIVRFLSTIPIQSISWKNFQVNVE
jgi:hypothetical protein